MRSLSRSIGFVLATAVAAGAMTVAATSAHASTMSVSKGGVRIVEIYFDSTGPDNTSNKGLNGEWVKVQNTTKFRKNITGWTLHDSSSHRYTFPRTILAPHATLRVHTGRGF